MLKPADRTWLSGVKKIATLGLVGTLMLSTALLPVGPAAQAASSASTGTILSDSGPLNRIALNATFNQQVVNNSVASGVGTFYQSSALTGAGSSYTRIFNSSGTTPTAFPAGTQTFGGSGTRSTPYFLQTTSTSNSGIVGISQSERLTYVEGDQFYRSDVSLTNTTATSQTLNYYRFADCTLAGTDSGFAAVSAESTQCLRSGVAIALIPITPGALTQGGHYNAVQTRVTGNAGLTNTCLNSSSVDLTPAQCAATTQDNGFAIEYRNRVIAPGATVNLSYLVSYSTTPPDFADLAVNTTTTAASTIPVGQQFSYTMNVTNNGPSNATNVKVQGPVPAQVQYLSSTPSTGSYNSATGLWTIPALANGATATLTVNVQATNAGAITLGVSTASSNEIDNSPCTSASDSGCGAQNAIAISGVDQNASTFSVSPGPQEANGSAAHTISVQLVAENGAPVPAQAIPLSATATPGSGVTVGPFATSGTPGLYTAPVTSTTAGNKSIAVTAVINGTPRSLLLANDGNDVAAFSAGEPNTAQSSVTIDDTDARIADGNTFHSVTVTMKDANGNPVTGAAGLLSAGVASGVVVEPFTESAVPGVYTTIVRSTVAGVQAVDVLVNGAVSLGLVDANFRAGELDLQNGGTLLELITTNPRTVADPLTTVASDAASVHTLRAVLKDSFGNPIEGETVVFSLPAGLAVVGGGAASADTDSSGQATINVVASQSGTYSVTAAVDGASLVNGSPQGVIYAAADAVFGVGQTELTASTGSVEVATAETHRVVVTARDSFGNPVGGANVEFTLAPELILDSGSLTGVTNSLGQLVILVRSNVLGSHAVDASVNGTNLAPVSVDFAAGAPAASASSWVINTSSPQPAGASYAAEVTVRDIDGFPVAAGVPVQFVLPAGVSTVESAPYLTDASGVVHVTFTSQVAGTYGVQAAIGANQIGATEDITFTNASTDVSQNGTQLARTSARVTATANGSDTHQITASLVDSYGNPVVGQDVTFTLPANVTVLGAGPTTVTTNSAGQAVIDIVSTVAASYQVTADVDGIGAIANGSPVSLSFVPGIPVEANSQVTVVPTGPLVVGTGAGNTYTATVTARDANNNPVPQTQILMFTTPSLIQSLPGGLTDATGQLQITLRSLTAGTFTVETDIIQNTLISPLSVPVNVGYVADTPDTGVSGRTTLSSTNGTQIANGSSVHTLTANLRDQYNNPIPLQSVTFDLPVELTPVGGSATVETGTDGIAKLDVTATDADLYQVRAYVGSDTSGAQILNGAPTTVIFGAGPANAAASHLTVTSADPAPLPVGTAAASTYNIDVLVEDAADNPIVDAVVDLSIVDGSGTPISGQPLLTVPLPNTDATGHLLATVTSTLAGEFFVQARVLGDEVAGSGAPVAWKVGAANATNSVLTLSSGERMADGTAHHTATVLVKDQFGNVIPGPTAVDFLVSSPASGAGSQTSGSDGKASTSITSSTAGTINVSAEIGGEEVYPGTGAVVFVDRPGPVHVNPTNGSNFSGTAVPGNTVVVTLPGNVTLSTVVLPDGTWSISPPSGTQLPNGAQVSVVQVTPGGTSSIPVVVTVDKADPQRPVVNPSDGSTVTGCAEPGSTIKVRNASGTVIGTGTAGSDCRFSITLNPKVAEGKTITIEVTDPSGNTGEPIQLRVGLPSISLGLASVEQGAMQVARGTGFQPGELVRGILNSDPIDLGARTANADGEVTFEISIPKDFEPGAHTVSLTGPRSGTVSAGFAVVAANAGGPGGGTGGLPVTGDNSVGLLVTTGVLLLASAWIFTIGTRRRRVNHLPI